MAVNLAARKGRKRGHALSFSEGVAAPFSEEW